MYNIPVEVFPPGEFLRDELEAREWTQMDLAEITGLSPTTVSQIINGQRAVSTDVAIALAAALGTSPDVWMNMEKRYQLWRNRDKDTSSVQRRARLYAYAPVRDMIARNWIPTSESVDVLERSVLRFCETESLDEQPALDYAARQSTSYSQAPTPSQVAWLCRARQLGRCLQVGRFSRAGAEEAVAKLRLLTHEPREARHVARILADAGVRFVIVAHLPGMKIDGACLWLNDEQPVLALSMRFDRVDNFWFNIMHEMHHVLNRVFSIDSDLGQCVDEEKPEWEQQADAFAEMTLVDQKALEGFIARKRPLFYTRAIELFASTQRTHPGIVVGQLQKKGELGWNQRKLLAPIREFVTATALTDGWGRTVPL